MSRVQAWELLNNPQYCSQLTMGEFHQLLIRAGHSEKDASQAAKKHGWNRLADNEIM